MKLPYWGNHIIQYIYIYIHRSITIYMPIMVTSSSFLNRNPVQGSAATAGIGSGQVGLQHRDDATAEASNATSEQEPLEPDVVL